MVFSSRVVCEMLLVVQVPPSHSNVPNTRQHAIGQKSVLDLAAFGSTHNRQLYTGIQQSTAAVYCCTAAAVLVAKAQSMDWVQEHCDRLRSELQDVLDGCTTSAPGSGVRKGLRVPWAWVCR